MLVTATIAVDVLAYRRHRQVPLAVAIAAALAIESAIPTPTADAAMAAGELASAA